MNGGEEEKTRVSEAAPPIGRRRRVTGGYGESWCSCGKGMGRRGRCREVRSAVLRMERRLPRLFSGKYFLFSSCCITTVHARLYCSILVWFVVFFFFSYFCVSETKNSRRAIAQTLSCIELYGIKPKKRSERQQSTLSLDHSASTSPTGAMRQLSLFVSFCFFVFFKLPPRRRRRDGVAAPVRLELVPRSRGVPRAGRRHGVTAPVGLEVRARGPSAADILPISESLRMMMTPPAG